MPKVDEAAKAEKGISGVMAEMLAMVVRETSADVEVTADTEGQVFTTELAAAAAVADLALLTVEEEMAEMVATVVPGLAADQAAAEVLVPLVGAGAKAELVATQTAIKPEISNFI